ncbi:efflux RND transporter permease subunit [Cytophagales bacterium LB-30]|uniref:Efflux RND transporter permease subunit n=1 Tax=Shiella aurantiaca TaxID=3058365 RepID=A0ABT8F9H1_9BACT|nr:efflux RND transporter permease subunit [Shiella aurantiaca]MDN4167014.1 efflux RND transporter permease subunit [Shiella aurantiaca]
MFKIIISYFLENRLVTLLLLAGLIAWGVVTAPFDWNTGLLPSDPVPVDAIPDIGENQQIVFTDWPGRSPQDIEDQITYPLTTALLGIPGVKSIRSTSMFGFSSIYLIFEEEVEFYWSRSRVLEKLNSLPSNLLPEGVQPALGPDATALGQVYWYTLEGRDSLGNPTGGWDLQELRSIQDFYVKYGLNAVQGVSEVASIGGYVKEYQIDVDPSALQAHKIGLDQVMMAVQNTNRDTGAETIEINRAEYVVRGLGYIKSLDDLRETVVTVNNNVPIRLKDIGQISLGPATRRGVLDKAGAEAVGGVVVARYGSNPLAVIEGVKEKIEELKPGLPQKTLRDGSTSYLTIVPFYDRTQLIQETIGTLEEALSHEVLISIIVVLVLVMNLRASLIISSLLPIGVLITFIVMRYLGVDANVVALSGIAIAIGVMVDVGIVFVENIIRHSEMPENQGVKDESLLRMIQRAVVEVGPAITTALATTVVSFLPVFFMENAEGKLFKPLAFTKTFALSGSFFLGLVVLPTIAYLVFNARARSPRSQWMANVFLALTGIVLAFYLGLWIPLALTAIAVKNMVELAKPNIFGRYSSTILLALVLLICGYFLSEAWSPLHERSGHFTNFIFIATLVSVVLAALYSVVYFYEPILKWCLENKRKFMLIPAFVILWGTIIWFGFNTLFGGIAQLTDRLGWNIRTTGIWSGLAHSFPGMGKEFMPSLNEGSFLLMPTSMPHAGVEENIHIVQLLDKALANIPEVETAVGKAGRVESALDPAPLSMFENVINYKSEFYRNDQGAKVHFKTNEDGLFVLQSGELLSNDDFLIQHRSISELVIDEDGERLRQWRSHIKSPQDIWDEITMATQVPGVTSSPKLQPIETRLVMLQTGMRAPMGIKVYGPDLATIEEVGLAFEQILKEVPSIKSEAVFADRIVGVPYLHLVIDRMAISRYGLSIEAVQTLIETAIGGMPITRTVEGRERYNVRVRYPRELRDHPEKLQKILVPTPMGNAVPLGDLVRIDYVQGPQMIKSEETFLTGYVLFDKKESFSEVDVVEEAKAAIQSQIDAGSLKIPEGVSYKFSGTYENQVRAVKRLAIVIPLCLIAIFLLLYFQFKTIIASTIHFSGVFVAFAGGFIMLWLYAQPWFMNFDIGDTNLRDVFQMHTINLSVAVWVGFIALFGIATDDGVLMGTYIHQVFEEKQPNTVPAVRAAVLEAGLKRVRPAMMTTATTLLALIPVLTSTGKGSDIMVPMAIPTFGGMVIQIMTIFVVPVLQAYWRETVVSRSSTIES